MLQPNFAETCTSVAKKIQF